MEDTQTILDDLLDFHLDHGDREIQKRVSDKSEALEQECTQIIEKAQSLVVAAASNYRDRQESNTLTLIKEIRRKEKSRMKITTTLTVMSLWKGILPCTGDKQATNANSAPVKPSDGGK